MTSLPFRVVYCTDEDPDFRADELDEHTPQTKGWQSSKNCKYPIEIGFQLDSPGGARLSQVQILSHQSKISSKVEIFIGDGDDYHEATFKRLGYLSLDTNERSSYQARELKTVYIDQFGKYFKLIVHPNHPNKVNAYNQVGIVALNLIGIEEIGNGKGISEGLSGYGQQPSAAIHRTHDHTQNISVNFASEMNLDPTTASKLRFLSEVKAQAVADEDYATAKSIKLIETELKSLGARLAQIDLQKREAVRDEDYDTAAALKEESRDLRKEIESKIRDIDIPGVSNGMEGSFKSKIQRRVPGINVDEVPITGYADTGPISARKGKPFPGDNNGNNNYEKPLSARGGDQQQQPHHLEMRSPSKLQMFDDNIHSGMGGGVNGSGKEADDGDEGSGEYEGEHPLEGIPNHRDLPAPEGLTTKSKELSDVAGIAQLIGDYRTRCLFSKTWGLREAVINKVRLLFEEEYTNQPGLSNCIVALCTIVRVGIDDKLSQLMFSAIPLLDDVLAGIHREKLSRTIVGPALEPVVMSLLEKLNDGAARVRETALKSLLAIAACNPMGSSLVGSRTLIPIQGKQKSLARPLIGRLQVLTGLVTSYGIGNSTSLSCENLMNYCKQSNAFAHSDGEVRSACKELAIAVQKLSGTDPIEPYLSILRPKQIEEYMTAFERSGGGEVAPQTKKRPEDKIVKTESKVGREKEPKRESPQQNPPEMKRAEETRRKQSEQGVGSTSPHHPHQHQHNQLNQANNQGTTEEEEIPDFTTCMFCGKNDRKWNEDALDLHYWKDCPLLFPCIACAQVVEIAGLPEHLVDECDAKNDYILDDVTGLAVKKAEYVDWRDSSRCKPAPADHMYCPLCLSPVADSDDDWKNHLVSQCPKNKRLN